MKSNREIKVVDTDQEIDLRVLADIFAQMFLQEETREREEGAA